MIVQVFEKIWIELSCLIYLALRMCVFVCINLSQILFSSRLISIIMPDDDGNNYITELGSYIRIKILKFS